MSQNITYPCGITLKRTHYEILRVSHCYVESVGPTSSTEAIFDIIDTFGTIQP